MADKKGLVCVIVDHSNASHDAEPRIIPKRGGVGKLLVKKRSILSIPLTRMTLCIGAAI
jgi:hypothetical protein